MRASVKWCLSVLIAFYQGSVARPGEGEAIDPSWIAKTRIEAKAVYEKYKALSSRLEEESEYRSNKMPGSSGTIPFREHTQRDRVVRLGNAMLLEQVRIFDEAPNKPQIRLQCDNEEYYFTLNKLRENAPYALAEYTPGWRKIGGDAACLPPQLMSC